MRAQETSVPGFPRLAVALSAREQHTARAVGPQIEGGAQGSSPGASRVAAVLIQAENAARNVVWAIAGRRMLPFRYLDKGKIATIGRGGAVADITFTMRAWVRYHSLCRAQH
jgi:NADH dehydrogenase FAD-containing subunit